MTNNMTELMDRYDAQLKELENSKSALIYVSVDRIYPHKDNPRKDLGDLTELSDSIKANGIMQNLTIVPWIMANPDAPESEFAEHSNDYTAVIGHRRHAASKLAGLSEIPAIVLEKDDRRAAEIALIENIQREDLNPLEEALAYKSLAEDYSLTQEELSAKVGKSRSAIANTLRLLDLPDEVLTLVASKELSAGHARTILGLKNREDMILLAQQAVENDLSVRVIEEEVKRMNKPKKEAQPEEEEIPIVDYFRELELRMQSHLGRRVKIEGKSRKKTITLTYEDNEDLDEIIKLLCGEQFLSEV